MEDERNGFSENTSGDFWNEAPIYIPASKMKRLANYLVDYICCFLIWMLIVALTIFIAASLGANVDGLENLELNRLEEILLGWVMFVSYYLFFEGLLGTTPGKELTRTLLITTDGYRPTFQTVFFRSLWRIVPFEAFSFLFSETGWHDRKTGTMVVDKQGYIAPFEPSEDVN